MAHGNKTYPGDQNTQETENGRGLNGGLFLLQGFW